jgi:hypothetical protein
VHTAERLRWYHKIGALLGAILIFELGVFLVVFPWLDVWKTSWWSGLGQGFERIWDSGYFRGAVSGLGLVNIWISFTEVFRLRRFSTHEDEEQNSFE